MSGSTDSAARDEAFLPGSVTHADELRKRMIQDLFAGKNAQSPDVCRAMALVPRHLFVPDATIESAYAYQSAITTKYDSNGLAISSASSPSIVAKMLDQLGDVAGKNVLEIGTATGYNAALIAEMVGDAGHVTSLEIDPDLAADAKRSLHRAGYDRVRVIVQDGTVPVPENSRFDAIIVTAAAWEVYRCWFDQLRSGGKLVVPLRWCGQTQSVELIRSVAPDSQRREMHAKTILPASFMPLVGVHGERTIAVRPSAVTLVCDDADVQVESLSAAMEKAPVVRYSGEFIDSNRTLDRIALRLASCDAGTGQIVVSPDTIGSSGLPSPLYTNHGPTVVRGGSLAYVIRRTASVNNAPDRELDELGAAGFGRYAAELSQLVCSQIVKWSTSRTATPSLSAYIQNDPPVVDAGLLLRRTESYLHISM